MNAGTYSIGDHDQHADVLDAWHAGLILTAPSGDVVTDLCCRECRIWIGDPDVPDIAHVSRAHDVEGRCEDCRPDDNGYTCTWAARAKDLALAFEAACGRDGRALDLAHRLGDLADRIEHWHESTREGAAA